MKTKLLPLAAVLILGVSSLAQARLRPDDTVPLPDTNHPIRSDAVFCKEVGWGYVDGELVYGTWFWVLPDGPCGPRPANASFMG